LVAYTVKEYISQYLHQYCELFDLLSSTSNPLQDLRNSFSPIYYSSYFPSNEITLGLKNHQYYKGVIRSERGDYNHCYVVIHLNDEKESSISVTITG
jgi:hypothetical protein